MKRLQGKEFQDMRHCLKMVSYEISSHGNVRANLKTYSQRRPGYFHWLNEYELKKFMNSEYFKTHEPTSGSKESLKTRTWTWTTLEGK